MLNATQFKFHLAHYAKVTEADADAFMNAVTQVLLQQLRKGEEVAIQGLGTFSVIETQQGRRVAFQIDDRMRSQVNAPFACFEPMTLAVKAEDVEKAAAPAVPDGAEAPDITESPEAEEQVATENAETPEITETPDGPEGTESPEAEAEQVATESTEEPENTETPEGSEAEEQTETESSEEGLEGAVEVEPEVVTETAEGAEAAEAVEPTDPAEVAEATESGEAAEAAQDAEGAESAETAEVAAPVDPGKPDRPGPDDPEPQPGPIYPKEGAAEPKKPEEPAKPVTPVRKKREPEPEWYEPILAKLTPVMQQVEEKTKLKPWMQGAIVGGLLVIILIITLVASCGGEKKAPVKPQNAEQTAVADSLSQAKDSLAETAAEEEAAAKAEAAPAAQSKKAAPAAKPAPAKAAPKRSSSSGGGSYVKSSPFTSAERPSNDILFQENGQPKKVSLTEGERLTLLALSTFGDKAFWAYIYDVNAFQLGDPNTVPKGLPLYLPDPHYFDIDASNPASVKKAQNRAMQILNDPQSDGPWGRR